MLSRRKFMQTSTVWTSMLVLGNASTASKKPQGTHLTWHMPDEGDEHKCTWMAFIASDSIWERVQIPVVRKDLTRIARTIAKYEPVNMLVSPKEMALAKRLLGSGHQYPITLIPFEVDDLWLRDTGPTFVLDKKGNKACIDFNFNGWGNDQAHTLDKKVAKFIANQSDVKVLSTDLVLEGGCFEVDGKGNAIMTKSCILNDNRNAGKSKEEVEKKLKALLGLENIIWLKGIKGKDITDGHTDFYARFSSEGNIVVSRDNYKHSHDYAVTRENITLLQKETDATLHIIDTPYDIHPVGNSEEDFAAGYIGYYLCNGAVIMQGFGDVKADKKARKTLAKLFPHRTIEQIRIDGIASGGGSIHCATQQEPK